LIVLLGEQASTLETLAKQRSDEGIYFRPETERPPVLYVAFNFITVASFILAG